MDSGAGIFLAASAFWAVASLAFQAVRTLRRFRTPYAQRVGDVRRALIYNFTIAMLPSHKESVALHPVSFGAGALLHLAVFVSLSASLSTLLTPTWIELAGPFFGWTAVAGLLAGLFLFVRRWIDRELRAISVPDDFVAICSVLLFLAATAQTAFGRIPLPTLQIVTGLLLVYLPLGKLRHALFFFLARADLGRKLGWRGVYPPPPKEAAHG